MEHLVEAIPTNWQEIIGAAVSLIVAVWAAFKRGRKVGHDRAMDGRA